jgi:hypothetical protein
MLLLLAEMNQRRRVLALRVELEWRVLLLQWEGKRVIYSSCIE